MDAFLSKLRFSGTTLSLVYSTFLGGSDWDSASGICVNTSGDVFVLGQTWSTDFPTVNPLPAPNNVLQGSGNIFVSRVSFSGSSLNLVYSTYLGGSSDGANLCTNCWGAHRIALDASGNVYVTGTTASTDFPVVNPLPGANNFLHGPADAFVSKLSFSGSALSLAFSTYLGGSGYDAGTAIAVDSSGNVYVTGATGSIDFPTVNPLPVRDGVGSFVTKLRPSGSTFNPVYSTYFAPTSSMVVDSGGNVYVSGTRYGGFPIVNPLPSPVFTPNGVMVAKISPETVVGPDTTPPLVTPIISGTSGNNGWYRSNVTLSWSVTDPESGIASSTGCAPAALTSDTAGTKITCSATNGAGLSTSASVTIKIDQTLPPVVLFGIIGGPPKQVQMSSIDVTSGLQTIQVPTCTNCTASTSAFTPGTKNAVITTATKTDATKGSSVKVVATDMAGNSTIFDPVDMTIQGEGKPEVHTLSISSLERVVQITNGNPGIHHMMLKVNQVEIPVSPLKNGERRSFDIGYALRAGQNNLITLTAFGGRQATAWIVFTEP
jgi:hypothetical protein